MADRTEIIIQANAFSQCADMMQEKSQKFADTFMLYRPAVVNCAFACELYLKALLFQQGNQRLHRLDKLWRKLPTEMRERLERELMERYGKIKDSFGRDYIEQIADAFSAWRYCYESSNLAVETGFLFVFRDVLHRECIRTLQIQGEKH